MRHDSIERRYVDAFGRVRTVPPETLRRIEAAIDVDESENATVIVARAGERVTVTEPADLVLENGWREELQPARSHGVARAARRWRVPADTPLGYHTIELHDTGRRVSLIVAPRRCHLPPGLRIWAWAVQLYAARSTRSWGIGDFGDLARFAAASRAQGCRLLLVNPLHAATPTVPQQPSPYSPTTRRYLNPLYLTLDDIPGADALPGFSSLAAEGRRLNAAPLIDRDRIFRLKMRVLWRLYERSGDDADFDAFVRSEGTALAEYAAFCVLAEAFGGNWRRWPVRFRHPRSPEVRRFVEANQQRYRFHQWLQWQLDRQLRRAAAAVPVMQDLPIGIDPNGADAWAWQDVLAEGMHVGVPPDEFNTQGQNWGLPPFVPARLKRAAYRPFIETIRGTMRHAGGLRIDHVMGLFRLFWIPDGMRAAEGAYVRNASDDLLAIIALESVRARAIIVGEDLGTVDERARRTLMDAGILSYRLLWFEKDDPARYPEQALTAVTTHDLPTIAGLWTGADLEAQHRLDLHPNEAGTHEIRVRLARLIGADDRIRVREVIRRTHEALARAPSVVVTATLEDVAGAEKRPNMPCTVNEWPNWCLPLPVPLDRLMRSRETQAVAAALNRHQTRVRRPAGRSRSGGRPVRRGTR